jgi:predicted nucleic acid-binding protein
VLGTWQILLMMSYMDHLFVDTWGWLSLADEKEKGHKNALVSVSDCLDAGGKLYTSDAVLFETGTLLFRRLPEKQALLAFESLLNLESMILKYTTPDRFEKVVQLRAKYLDQPKISLTDFLSFVIMKEHSITRVLSEDKHFEFVHFGFERVY